jgi:hypothetical protein
LKLAFDEHIPRGIVKVFQVLAGEGSIPPVTDVVSARDYAKPGDKGDDQHWVHRFSIDGGKIIISGDKRMRARVHERRALTDENMIVFFFSPAWSRRNSFVKSAMLLNWWPKILETASAAANPSLWNVPFQWEWKGLKQIAIPKNGG